MLAHALNAHHMASPQELEQAHSRLAHLTERNALLEEENRWLKSQLFGRSSEKRTVEIAAEQARLFNEAEALAQGSAGEPETITIPAHERKKRGRKRLPAELPRIEIVHDLRHRTGIRSSARRRRESRTTIA
ncbi:MAG: hypothetical protein HC872_00670 [Gammaproteobacteria bacterium]|nr:hypothetical protein [Gammaproteobacteria bacterium]